MRPGGFLLSGRLLYERMQKEILLRKAALLPSAGLVKAGTVVRVSRVVADSLIASGAAEEPPVKVETKKAAPRRRAAKAS